MIVVVAGSGWEIVIAYGVEGDIEGMIERMMRSCAGE
jgi:hypothetical protein